MHTSRIIAPELIFVVVHMRIKKLDYFRLWLCSITFTIIWKYVHVSQGSSFVTYITMAWSRYHSWSSDTIMVLNFYFIEVLPQKHISQCIQFHYQLVWIRYYFKTDIFKIYTIKYYISTPYENIKLWKYFEWS